MTDWMACRGCIYKSGRGSDQLCAFLLLTGRVRPCPPGRDCTVKTMEGEELDIAKALSFDEVRAVELLGEGKSAGEIAAELGVTRNKIYSWANRRGFIFGVPPAPAVEEQDAETPEENPAPEAVEVYPASAEPVTEMFPTPEPARDDPVELSLTFRGCCVDLKAASIGQLVAAASALSVIAKALDEVPEVMT